MSSLSLCGAVIKPRLRENHAAEGMLNTRGDGIHVCPVSATALAAEAANRIGRARRRSNQPRRAAAGAPRLVGSFLARRLARMREGRA